MHFNYSTYHSLTQHPCPGGHKIYNFGRPFLCHYHFWYMPSSKNMFYFTLITPKLSPLGVVWMPWNSQFPVSLPYRCKILNLLKISPVVLNKTDEWRRTPNHSNRSSEWLRWPKQSYCLMISGETGSKKHHTNPPPSWPYTSWVSFKIPFQKAPTVTIGLTLLDSGHNRNLRIYTQVRYVSSSGFQVKMSKWDNTELYGSQISWMACGYWK